MYQKLKILAYHGQKIFFSNPFVKFEQKFENYRWYLINKQTKLPMVPTLECLVSLPTLFFPPGTEIIGKCVPSRDGSDSTVVVVVACNSLAMSTRLTTGWHLADLRISSCLLGISRVWTSSEKQTLFCQPINSISTHKLLIRLLK